MSTTTPADGRADVRDMYVVHRAFRREFGLVPRLIRRTPAGDVARADAIAQHLDLMLAGLHMHHTGEDEVLWPLLLARATPSRELIETMQAQHENVDGYADQMVAQRAATYLSGARIAGAAVFPELTGREREVLDLVARGHDNATIARRLVLSDKTVRNYLYGILTKLGVPDRSQLIVLAREAGLGVAGGSPGT